MTETIATIHQLLKRIDEITLDDYRDIDRNEIKKFGSNGSCPQCNSKVSISFTYDHPGFPPSTSYYLNCENGDWNRRYHWNVFDRLEEKDKKMWDDLDAGLKKIEAKGMYLGECSIGGSLFLISGNKSGCIQPRETEYAVNCTKCGEGLASSFLLYGDNKDISAIFEETKEKKLYRD